MKNLKILSLVVLCFIFACSDDDSISSNNPAMNECLGAGVPFPDAASINACVDIGQGISVVFNPNLTWQQSINFFSSNYNSDPWVITEHEIFDYDTNEREATWSIVGPEFDVEISITAFGNDNTGFIVGSYIIYY
ncbi:MAG: hypothetical protein LAT51_04470 [Flavobacteriaceae bacterium]|nr:hypothetical protein [Flavobacteriaceae bacterium]